MKKIRIIIALALALSTALTLVACGSKERRSGSESEKTTSSPVVTGAQTEGADTLPSYDGSNAFEYNGLYIDLPEGFTTQSGANGVVIAVPSDYPAHADNIAFNKANDKIEGYTEEALREVVANMSDSYDNFELEKGELDGVPYAEAYYTLTSSGVDMEQVLITFFFDDYSVTVTFTSVTGDYDNDFALSISSISFAKG